MNGGKFVILSSTGRPLVSAWADEGLVAVATGTTPPGAPAGISADQARELAAALMHIAGEAEAQ